MLRFFDVFSRVSDAFSALPDPELTDDEERVLGTPSSCVSGPLVLRRNSDAGRPDHLFFGGSPAVRIVSQPFVAALSACGATGWTTYPVTLLDDDGTTVGDHVGLVTTGRSGPLIPLDPHDVSKHRTGVRIDEDQWDGSDVFSPAEQNMVVVVERVRDALFTAELNLAFEELSEMSYDRWLFE